jgi:hypothetical protein
MAMFKGKERRKMNIYIYIYIYRFNSNVGGGETTINFARITKEKEEDICSQGIYPNSP